MCRRDRGEKRARVCRNRGENLTWRYTHAWHVTVIMYEH